MQQFDNTGGDVMQRRDVTEVCTLTSVWFNEETLEVLVVTLHHRVRHVAIGSPIGIDRTYLNKDVSFMHGVRHVVNITASLHWHAHVLPLAEPRTFCIFYSKMLVGSPDDSKIYALHFLLPANRS